MNNLKLFSPNANADDRSPVKNLANPEYKPFDTGYSSSYSSLSGAKSEDDSPLRRRLMKSPKKKKRIMHEKEHDEYVQKVLNESDLLDHQLKNQIKFV